MLAVERYTHGNRKIYRAHQRSVSHEYYNIVIGGEGVRRRSNGINAEKITFFSNFVIVSKGLLSTIVWYEI